MIGGGEVVALVPMEMRGLAVVEFAPAPVVLSREVSGLHRWLAIEVGEPEARELISAHLHLAAGRPGPIELLGQLVGALGNRVERVEVTELYDGIFHADLVFAGGVRVSARPSDAIAVALRAGTSIEVADAVLDEASVELIVMETDEDQWDDEGQEIEQFRSQLDDLSAEDFRDTDQ